MRGRTNLVVPLGRFVGRVEDLSAIDRMFHDGVRLVTLVGSPGMGKTRLALRYADVHGEGWLHAGGVWFCDLTEAIDVSGMCGAVSRAMARTMSAAADVGAMVDDVADALARAGSLLLVLDNFEQLPRSAARAVERWCAMVPDMRVLVTSRERLGVTGESVFDLAPLGLPRPGQSDAALRASEAASLYEERARAAGGWDDARPPLATDVAALVRGLDGIPLAIELAAARSRVLSAPELSARLASRAGSVLLGGARQLSSRHETLRAAIDWSWSMLTDAERSALAQCSIFAGQFALEAAERVLDLGAFAPGVLDVVSALHDKSLLRGATNGAGDATRFSLYVSIREYASERLATMPEAFRAALAERHRRFFVDVTRPWADAFARTGDAASRARLANEKDNLLAIERALRAKAARAALDAAENEDLARVILHLAPTIQAETPLHELVSVYTAGVEAAVRAGDDALGARLRVERGNAYGIRGDTAACLEDLEVARALAAERGDRALEAEALVMASVRYRQQARFDDAWAAGQAAATLLLGAGHPRAEGANFAVMGLLMCELGRAEESRTYNLEARAIFRAADDPWSEGLAIANLAQVDQAAGAFAEAAQGYEAAIERFRALGDRRYEGRYLGYRGTLEHERGDLVAARGSYATCIEMLGYFAVRHQAGLFRGLLGALEAAEAHAREARAELDAADDLLRGVEAPAYAAAIHVHRGHLDLLLARESEPAEAARLVAAARARLVDVPLATHSEDVRIAIRLLERALTRPKETPRSTRAGLRVGPGARTFAVGNAAPVDMSRRGAVRSILLALATRRLAAPGEPLDAAALLASGWPGERVLPEAAGVRVRVAISTLRRLGLAGVLLTRESGYLLDPRVTADLEPEV